MALRSRQQGITLMGMIMVISVGGIFAYCGMKIFPMYQEFWAVKEAMEQVAQEPNIANAGRARVVDLLFRRFNVSYVTSVKQDNIVIDAKKGNLLIISYEVRTPLAYNLDVIGKFEHTVKLGGG